MIMHSSSDSIDRPTAKTAICTLFEGDYHFGLAAFVNSLAHAGFAGTVWVGYRGELPPWLGQLKRVDTPGAEYLMAEPIRLVFVPLETALHLTNYKPQFMLDLFSGLARDCDYIWYFDPDIFIRCKWTFFADWQNHGIALCQEITNNMLPENSPLRHKWMRIGARIGLGDSRPLNHYFNGGMVGVSAEHMSFLHIWRRLVDESRAEGCDLEVFRVGDREMSFYGSDQDALNIAAMYTEYPLTTMGPEAMGFVPGGFTMFHAVGQKPWRGSFLLRALKAMPPSDADKFFLTQVSSPICAYSSCRLMAKRLACAIAAFVGRFYRRR
jgi:hypothetical protein